MLPRPSSPNRGLLCSVAIIARVIARKHLGLLFLLLVALSPSAATRSVAVSRLKFAWTGGVPFSSFRFTGAASEQYYRFEPLFGKSERSKGKFASQNYSLGSGVNMKNVEKNAMIPTENSPTTKEMASPIIVNESRKQFDGDKVMSDEETPIKLPSPNFRGRFCKHFIFLVHGWLGNEMEMSYIEDALNRAILSSPLLSRNEEGHVTGSGGFVVHKISSNNGKTADGIAAGGSRLADEILETIRSHMEQHKRRHSIEGDEYEDNKEDPADVVDHVAFSIVGNSLGGLYARYALSVLPVQLGNVVIHPKIFCTTATPHLGVASHTYIPIPRVAERVVGRVMGRTGRDLFRLDPRDGEDRDLIYRMSTQQSFLHPLSKFEKRIAYANAFRSDFQVPTDTAAFLSSLSAYPHRIDRTYKEEFVATIVHTESHDWRKVDTGFPEASMEHDILTMSTKLDSLGWTKVFVDVRERIPMPSVALPGVRRRNSRSEIEQFVTDRHESGAFNDSGILIESRELVALMNPSERLHFPLGHTVMVANSKSEWFAKVNEQGKPVMDMLASELVEDMLRLEYLEDEDMC